MSSVHRLRILVLFILWGVFSFGTYIFNDALVTFTWYVVTMFLLYRTALLCYPLTAIHVTHQIVYDATLSKYVVTLHFKRKDRFPLWLLVYEEQWRRQDYQRVHRRVVHSPLFQKEWAETYTFSHVSRGHYTLEHSTAVVADGFGVVKRQRFVPTVEVSFYVYPQPYPLSSSHHSSLQCENAAYSNRQSIVPEGFEPATVRPYVVGDSMRSIHWKASARASQWMAKSYEVGAESIDGLYVDLSNPNNLEERLRVALSLLQRREREREPFTFQCGTMQSPIVVNDQSSYERCMRQLAEATVEEECSMPNWTEGHWICIVSDLQPEQMVQRSKLTTSYYVVSSTFKFTSERVVHIPVKEGVQ